MEEKKKVTIKLNDGAMFGLSDGAKMDVISSIVEYVDNAEDQGATKVSIHVDNENNILSVLSVEETDLEQNDYSKLFNLGVGTKLQTKKNGVGKYSQGFKYAGSNLIGEGNKGKVIVAVKPISGNNWGAIQNIDYTDESNYTDIHVELTDYADIPDEYNFMVKVVGCRNITNNDLLKLRVDLGIRYREKIEKGYTKIDINGVEIYPQDRLYSKHGVRVDYSGIQFLEWNGDKNAATWEWVDLRKTAFNECELIEYDTTLGIPGRQKGATISSRSCIEIAINGVTIIYDKELSNLTGITAQPSSCGFRGRLNFINRDFADKYIKGGNKSCSMVDRSFSENDDTQNIRQLIKDVYNEVIKRYHNDDRKKNYYSITKLDNWCEKNEIECSFKFSNDDENVEAFIYDKTDNVIIVNINNFLMQSNKNDDSRMLFIISLLYGKKEISGDKVYKYLKKFKSYCEINDII